MSKRIVIWVSALILVLAGATALFGYQALEPAVTARANLPRLDNASVQGFKRAIQPMAFIFPKDHGPHPEFQTEWWYYTGNLQSENGERFGYQLTFFRRAIGPLTEEVKRQSAWGTNQIYLAHFALTSIAQRQFYFSERFSREAIGMAGAQGAPMFKVWLDDWGVEQISERVFRLYAREQGLEINLTLEEAKPLVFHGERGLSQKGPQPGNASYYISQTRLKTNGQLSIEGKDLQVYGESWMDHEFSTSALSAGQVGWDWFSLQLDDGSELMVYTIRTREGRTDAFSKGTLVRPDGSIVGLEVEDFQIQVNDTWKSPYSGAVYPAKWVVRVPGEDLELTITPLLSDQELRVSFTYWEGAVEVSGNSGQKKISGRGYVELTGYAQSMEGEF